MGTFGTPFSAHRYKEIQRGLSHETLAQRGTAKSRLQRTCLAVREWCKKHLHLPVEVQAKALGAKLRGHYNHFGITGNARALGHVFHAVRRTWLEWLNRRSQRRHMNWERYAALLERYPLPAPRLGARGWRAANP